MVIKTGHFSNVGRFFIRFYVRQKSRGNQFNNSSFICSANTGIGEGVEERKILKNFYVIMFNIQNKTHF